VIDVDPDQGSIRCPKPPHCEFYLPVRQLPPLLNNRHETAVWKFTDDFTSLNASRFDRQPERLSHDSFNRLTPVGHTLGKIAGFLRQGAPQKAKPPP